MRKSLVCLAIISCFLSNTNGQSNDTVLTNIVNKLTSFSSIHKIEKAYLQFDKPYYAAGDTLYFKAYVTAGERHQLTDISGALHVDFISTKNTIEQSIALQIDSGICWGDFVLPDSLRTGNYRVRAYTQWMRNRGETDFFEQNIAIGSLKKANTDSLPKQSVQTTKSKADLQFFPEGGNLVIDIPTKIAFKAIATNGLSVTVKGVVVDKQNKEVATFASTHAGMGYFFITPTEGNSYKAKVTFGDGTQNVVDLATPVSAGASLMVANNSDAKTSIRVMVNNAFYHANQNKDLFLLIYSGGTVITAPFTLDANVISLNIAKQQLHTGIASVTLFSTDGELLCERLFFVQNQDELSLHIDSCKTEYNKRQKVKIVLNAKAAAGANATGHFSISVVDESIVPANDTNETTILTHLLLTSDVKGYVEQPNYYFLDTGKQAHNDLDVLMLTQGYCGFEWKQVFDSSRVPLTYLPEKGFDVSGMVTSLGGKPLENASINLLPADGGFVLSRTTDNKGLFHFSNLIFKDSFHFILSAAKARGSNLTRITYFTENHQPAVSVNQEYSTQMPADSAMQVYLQNTKKYRNVNAYYDKDKSHFLKPVTVNTIKKDDQYRTSSLAGAGHADQVMHAEEIEQIGGQLSTSLDGRLRGVGFINGRPYLRGIATSFMQIIVDGTEMPTDSLSFFKIDDIPSSQIETIEVLKYASASIYGMNGGNGVLIITTKQGDERFKDVASYGMLPITLEGFYKARTFYSPKYDYKNINSKQPDLRSTIYWNPEIKTDANGNASIEYNNADGTGTYKITIEGID
ncbi:MAG: TonB-dependent receptor plug domain-containing protein, partial [Bacteroidota bacterium]|nr:TonB-dependent receptor plug domain-containing protein [Bacteroidota bacterium]